MLITKERAVFSVIYMFGCSALHAGQMSTHAPVYCPGVYYALPAPVKVPMCLVVYRQQAAPVQKSRSPSARVPVRKDDIVYRPCATAPWTCAYDQAETLKGTHCEYRGLTVPARLKIVPGYKKLQKRIEAEKRVGICGSLFELQALCYFEKCWPGSVEDIGYTVGDKSLGEKECEYDFKTKEYLVECKSTSWHRSGFKEHKKRLHNQLELGSYNAHKLGLQYLLITRYRIKKRYDFVRQLVDAVIVLDKPSVRRDVWHCKG